MGRTTPRPDGQRVGSLAGAAVLALLLGSVPVPGGADERHNAPVVVEIPAAIFVADPSAALARAIETAAARQEAAAAAVGAAPGPIVRLPPGRFHLRSPLMLTARSSGRLGAPVVIEGAPGRATVLSGAVALGPGRAVGDDDPVNLPKQARPHVTRFTLPVDAVLPVLQVRQGQGHARVAPGSEPFLPGRDLRLASWPNRGFARVAEVLQPDRVRLSAAGSEALDGQGETGAWAHGYWGKDWADEWIPMDGPVGTPGVLALRGGPPSYGPLADQRVRVAGLAAALDSPGEWHLDATTRQLYLWLPAAGPGEAVQLTRLATVLSVQGARHLRIRDLVVEGARGDAVEVQGGQDVRLERLEIRHAGLLGARLSGVDHAILDSDLHATGQGGIQLWGGDRTTLTPGRLEASGNRIRQFDRWVRTYRPALLVGGAGNILRGNLIEGGPHVGILFFGNDHLIELNQLAGLATETGDVGAIYTGMDWTARGTVIRHNVLQDIRGPGLHGSRGIYLDDQASGITVQGNVFVRVDQAVFLGGGRDNLVDGNLFVGSSPAIHLDDRGLTWQKAQTDDPAGLLRKRLHEVPYQGAAYARYPGLARLLDLEPGRPLGNVARRNAVFDGPALHFHGSAGRDLQVDRLFDARLLRFADGPPMHERDFATLELLEDSPALREGFPRLPWARMRCTRARWAAAAAAGPPRDDVPDCRQTAH